MQINWQPWLPGIRIKALIVTVNFYTSSFPYRKNSLDIALRPAHISNYLRQLWGHTVLMVALTLQSQIWNHSNKRKMLWLCNFHPYVGSVKQKGRIHVVFSKTGLGWTSKKKQRPWHSAQDIYISWGQINNCAPHSAGKKRPNCLLEQLVTNSKDDSH